ncbi:leucine-rich repeat extensin-like protein 1 [Eurytemora carolleeae]|uniref:leucine-rich repeat extensin-like protein 1 n=1 Tax=Eurytemora carolleeae TaxID=1294199 RepID=UPI000C77ADF5|nr:leucine-rich repeat extensin-like protein 1 [Eurytemora carolleeae]|eukprot:XP_023334922.1 leucine-rich repeat extensin-like protein 1 [Eurytemora affinis]
MNPTTPLHEDTLTFEINPTSPLHEDTLTFGMNPTTPLHEDTLTFEMNPTTPLHEDTLTFEMNPTTPLHEDTLTFEMNPTTPLHEDTLTFEMNPTTPLHEDTLTFEMNSATPLHEDTSNGQPPETPHHEIQRCKRNTPCKLPGCMICQTPTKPGSSNPLVSPTYPNPPIEPDPLSSQGFQPTHSNLIPQPIPTLRPIQLIRLNLTLSPSRPDPSSLIPSLTSDSTEARNLAPAPSSRPEPAQDEFHADHTKTEQLNCILSSN